MSFSFKLYLNLNFPNLETLIESSGIVYQVKGLLKIFNYPFDEEQEEKKILDQLIIDQKILDENFNLNILSIESYLEVLSEALEKLLLKS